MNVDLNGNTLINGYFSGDGQALTDLNASNLATGAIPGALLATTALPGANLVAGTVLPAALANGGTIPNSSTFYRGDGMWQPIGSITSQGGYKNIVIGGDFSTNPWQRGTIFTGVSSGVNYTADRWFASAYSGQNQTISQVAAGLAGFGSALRYQRPAGNTVGLGGTYLGQCIRSANMIPLQGRSVTFSFWARAGATFSATSSILQFFFRYGTGIDEGALAGNNFTWTGAADWGGASFTLTTSWQRFSTTFVMPTAATEGIPFLSWNDTGTAGAADYVDFAGIQLEANAIATDFETRPIELELALCQAYYEIGGGGALYGNYCAGQSVGATAKGLIAFKVTKRVVPTIALIGSPALWAADNASGTPQAGTAIASSNPTLQGFELDLTASGLTAGNATNIRANNSTAQGWTANAEL